MRKLPSRMKNIYIADPLSLERKIVAVKKDGAAKLHVVADFDRTLTPEFVDGKKAPTAIAHLREGTYLTPDYAPRAFALKDEYYPIEISPTIPLEEKRVKMLEWWTRHVQLMVECGLTKAVIDQIVEKRLIRPRTGSLLFYDILHQYGIPLIIFSGAKGDLIEGFLHLEGKMYDNIHIISNFFDFDADGRARGYKGSIIHCLNKNEGQIKNAPFFASVKNRTNIVLLGDSLGDAEMVDGLSHDVVVKIGFLNDYAERSLPAYVTAFDVVLLHDAPMNYINDLLQRILS